jgi:hypothetical protein
MKPLLIALMLGLALSGTVAMATEEPPFAVSLAEGDFALRDYPPLVVAEVTVTGDQKAAASKGFRLLAGYIFGGNTRRQSISMTAPVVQAPASETIAMTAPVLQTGHGDAWTVRFVMPQGMTLATLPVPNDPAVKLRALPPARVAVVRFSGLARSDDVAARTRALEAWITSRQLHATGAPSLAQYNPPWTPWFMRRNEVMIPVAR